MKKKDRLSEFIPLGSFQRPDAFLQRLQQQNGPVPRLTVSALPVYLILVAAIAYWCYYGYRYNQEHFPVSLTALVGFFAVFLVLFILLMWFRAYHRQVRIYPVLKRAADRRPGTFLFTAATSYTLFYARENWIGKVSFEEGSELENAFTRMEATIRHKAGTLVINRRKTLNELIGLSEKDKIQLPDSDFSRKFTVSGPDAGFAGRLLNSTVTSTIMGLEEFAGSIVELDGNSISVQIGRDLSSPRQENCLNQFLETAENIIEAAAERLSGGKW